jgi:hypothetical protein
MAVAYRMAVEKLSISMDASLVKMIRDAASAEGVTVSMWLSEAAASRAREAALREALREDSREHGALSKDEIKQLAAAARERSIVIRPKKRK